MIMPGVKVGDRAVIAAEQLLQKMCWNMRLLGVYRRK